MSGAKVARGYRSAQEIPDELRSALGSLLLSLADNKRLLGMHYGEWLLGAPTLGAGIACSAMAQDEWGHGRIVYAMLKDFGHDPAHLEHGRASAEYLSSELLDEPPSGWPGVVALNFLFDTALTVQFEALQGSRFEPLHYKVRKLLEEERFHFEHGRGWTERLATTEAGRAALSEAFGEAWTGCLRWFGSPDSPLLQALVEGGFVDGAPDDLRARWLEKVGPVLDAAGLELAVREGNAGWQSTIEPEWDGWDGTRRRHGAGGPSEEILARVRGDRNRAMLMD